MGEKGKAGEDHVSVFELARALSLCSSILSAVEISDAVISNSIFSG